MARPLIEDFFCGFPKTLTHKLLRFICGTCSVNYIKNSMHDISLTLKDPGLVPNEKTPGGGGILYNSEVRRLIFSGTLKYFAKKSTFCKNI